jgi:CrcB protein
MDWLWVAVGAGLGGMARYWCSGAVARHIGETFPWGTLVVNVAGSCLVGLFAALTAAGGLLAAAPDTRQLLITGLCGGYTTFSSFSLQTLNLARDEEWLYAGGNIVASVVLCLLFVWLGHIAAAALNQLKGT